jgi:pyruvyl transferase EpsO
VLEISDEPLPVALLDVPGHANVGDQVIYLGELNLLKAAGLDIRFQCRMGQRFEQNLLKLHPEGPILMHGGGNLGDLWPDFQEWRELVIEAFGDRAIVVLPQSLHFESAANAERARRVFAGHPNLTLLLRDSRSLEQARRLFPETKSVYCPDASIGFDAVSPATDGEVDVLVLQRGDKESREAWTIDGPFSQETYDWSGATAAAQKLKQLSWSDNRKLNRAVGPASHLLAKRRSEAYKVGAQEVVASGARLLSRGRVVATDRLHAAVLGRLLGRPVVALDNSYGKISAAMDGWVGELGGVTMVRDSSEIAEMVTHLAAKQRGV